MDWLKKMMAGRYGSDQLSTALLVLSILLVFISGLSSRFGILLYISYVPLGLCIYRILSRDITRRRMENYKFAMLTSPIYSWALKNLNRLKDAKYHKYFTCPNCRSTLRLPRGKGKISITCPKCRAEFIRKT